MTNLEDVVDAAYCSLDLHEHRRELGHVPLIDHNPHGGEKSEFAPRLFMTIPSVRWPAATTAR